MIDGTYSILYLDIGQGFLPVGSLTANSFSETVETLDTTNIENGGWKTYVLTKQEYTINFSGVAINSLYAGGDNTKFSYDIIKTIKRNRTLIDWKVQDNAGNLDYGKCYITELSSESNIDEFISFNATLLGYGVPNEQEEPEEPDNEAPTVIVTSDLYSMILPTNQTNLQATASDADGSIVSYLWTKVAGGNVNIVSPTSITTDITGMVEDSYIFRCTVTDNDGLIAFDQKVINVLAQQEVYPTISSSLPNALGEGTLDFSNGNPNEVVNLLFEFTIGNQGNPGGAIEIDFSSPVQVAPLDSQHLSRLGTVTLDSGGNASSNYEMEGQNLVCTVTITGNNDSTQFNN